MFSFPPCDKRSREGAACKSPAYKDRSVTAKSAHYQTETCFPLLTGEQVVGQDPRCPLHGRQNTIQTNHLYIDFAALFLHSSMCWAMSFHNLWLLGLLGSVSRCWQHRVSFSKHQESDTGTMKLENRQSKATQFVDTD